MYHDCLRYCAAVKRMQNPLVDADLEQLNKERAELHEHLCDVYDTEQGFTKKFTDKLPDMPVEQQAEWLEQQMEHATLQCAYYRATSLFHDGWEYINGAYAKTHPENYAKLRESLLAYNRWYSPWIKLHGCISDGSTMTDAVERFCLFVADVADTDSSRLYRPRAFWEIVDEHCTKKTPTSDWHCDALGYYASRLGLTGKQLRQFLENTPGDDAAVFEDRLQEYIADNARQVRDKLAKAQEDSE